ncbi:unnamed protein product [Nesidiocoris tenuis]|uniref:Uncharacterized protein n=1 Tax=Nesidiocoris tenuis TaxID=355587 RepID=A0A6H5GVB6_9HEMI|nr:unnamed protein product [Nesidiocoris tenuis]
MEPTGGIRGGGQKVHGPRRIHTVSPSGSHNVKKSKTSPFQMIPASISLSNLSRRQVYHFDVPSSCPLHGRFRAKQFEASKAIKQKHQAFEETATLDVFEPIPVPQMQNILLNSLLRSKGHHSTKIPVIAQETSTVNIGKNKNKLDRQEIGISGGAIRLCLQELVSLPFGRNVSSSSFHAGRGPSSDANRRNGSGRGARVRISMTWPTIMSTYVSAGGNFKPLRRTGQAPVAHVEPSEHCIVYLQSAS